jgi:hypothetical protein
MAASAFKFFKLLKEYQHGNSQKKENLNRYSTPAA